MRCAKLKVLVPNLPLCSPFFHQPSGQRVLHVLLQCYSTVDRERLQRLALFWTEIRLADLCRVDCDCGLDALTRLFVLLELVEVKDEDMYLVP
jgi:hypothetical protein